MRFLYRCPLHFLLMSAVLIFSSECTEVPEDFLHIVLQDHQIKNRCVKPATYCRAESYLDSRNETHLDVNCLCPYGPEEVSPYLEDLMKRPCALVPMSDDQRVDYATFNVTNCYVKNNTVPVSLMTALRRSRHLIIWIERAEYLRLPLQLNSQTDDTKQLTVAMKVIESSLSGIGKGLLSGTNRLRFEAMNSNLSVIDSEAFTRYSHDTSDVAINIVDCIIHKLAKGSVLLPLSGRMVMERVRIDAIDGGAIAGSGEILFKNSTIKALHTGAVNFADLVALEIDSCSIGKAYERAVRHHSLSSEEFSDAHVMVSDTQLMIAHGSSFVETCHAAQVTWDNNLIMDIDQGPFMLENDNCHMAPSSIITNTRMNCNDCDSLELPLESDSICPVYGSAWCSFCKGIECLKPLKVFIASECVYGKSKARKLEDLCKGFSQRIPRQRRFRSSSGSLHKYHLNMLMCIAVLFITFILH